MERSDKAALVVLEPEDVAEALLLSDEAGWNQTLEDWRIFIEQGKTIGFRAPDGHLVATGAALPYQSLFGFVSMILVTQSWRRRGLATSLLHSCIAHLREPKLTPMLDATPAGAAVYRQHGFQDIFSLDRWELLHRPLTFNPPPLGSANSAEVIANLDAKALGTSRRPVLARFLERDGARAFLKPEHTGFALLRRGRRASQVGPIVAATQRQAIELLDQAFGTVSGAVFIDVPSAWTEIGDWLTQRGGRIQRSFSRMALHRSQPFGDPARLFAVAGPEFG
jgi:GNAT superfamily N-acetyltransferase